MNKTIILVRHGYTGEKYKSSFIGSTDVPLSVRGFNQARKVASRLQKFKGKIFVSPMKRAMQTAGEIIKKCKQDFTIIPELKEIDFGDIETLSLTKVMKRYPDLLSRWMKYEKGFKFPGGESLKDFNSRVARAARLILTSESDNILVVAHGGVIRVLICFFLKLNLNKSVMFDIKNTSVTTLNLYDDRAVLFGVNDFSHLE